MRLIVNMLVGVPMVALSVLLALAAHELGHVIGGAIGGLRFAMFAVGPLMVIRSGDRLAWRRNPVWAMAGGMAASVPVSSHGLRAAYMRTAIGGPLASLALGSIALAGVFWVRPALPPDVAVKAVRLGLLTFGSMSFGLGVVTLWPTRVGGLVSDGARALAMRRFGPHAERHAAVMALGGCAAAGQRPRDWPATVVATALSLPDGSYDDVLAHYLGYFHALDTEDLDVVHAHVQQMVEHAGCVPEAFRPVIAYEAAYVDALYSGDARSARSRLASAGRSALVDVDTRGRVEAAVLLAEGRPEEALAAARRSLASLGRYATIGTAPFFIAELQRLLTKAGEFDAASV